MGAAVGGCLLGDLGLVVVFAGAVVLPVEALGRWYLRWLWREWVVVVIVMKGV